MMTKEQDQFNAYAKPDYFMRDVVCPYCKKASLGICCLDDDEKSPKYNFYCMNVACVTNAILPIPFSLNKKVKEALGQ